MTRFSTAANNPLPTVTLAATGELCPAECWAGLPWPKSGHRARNCRAETRPFSARATPSLRKASSQLPPYDRMTLMERMTLAVSLLHFRFNRRSHSSENPGSIKTLSPIQATSLARRRKPQCPVEFEVWHPLHCQGIAHIRDSPVGPPCAWLRSLFGHDHAVHCRERIGDQECILSDLLQIAVSSGSRRSPPPAPDQPYRRPLLRRGSTLS